jgi:hypothetical protein
LIKKNKFNCVFLSLNIVIVSKNLKKLTNNVSLSNEKIYKHSWCVHVRWNPLEHNPSRPVETRRNPFRLTRLNPSKHVTTCRKHVQTCWNTFPVDPMNFLFYIFIFLYFYIFYFIPPPLLLLLHPPQFPPISPYSFFVFLGRGGGRGRGRGRGRRRHRGGATTTAGRSPLRRGGGQSPPPFSLKQKTKFTNQTTYVL